MSRRRWRSRYTTAGTACQQKYRCRLEKNATQMERMHPRRQRYCGGLPLRPAKGILRPPCQPHVVQDLHGLAAQAEIVILLGLARRTADKSRKYHYLTVDPIIHSADIASEPRDNAAHRRRVVKALAPCQDGMQEVNVQVLRAEQPDLQ